MHLRRTTAALATLALTGCGGGGSSPTKRTSPQATSGERIFTSVGCSNCHTLKAAGAKGQVGPDLDHVHPTAAEVARQVTRGGGGMPSFAGQLSTAEIRAVAEYVAEAARSDRR